MFLQEKLSVKVKFVVLLDDVDVVAYGFCWWSLCGTFVKVFPGSLDAYRVRDISIERGDVQRDKERVVRGVTK